MPRKKEYDRKDVIEKAMRVFWDNGYKGTSMRILQKKMGINLYSIYADFGSKEGLFIEALTRYQILNKEVILQPLLNSKGRLEDIRQFFYGFVRSVKLGEIPNGCLFANTAMEFGDSNRAVTKKLNLFFTVLNRAFIGLLDKAKSNNELSDDANINKYANYLVGCTEGLAVVAKVLERKKLRNFIDISIEALK